MENKICTYSIRQILSSCLLITGFLLLPGIAHAGTTPNFTLEFGPIETVYDYSTEHCFEWDIPDFTARALVDANGNLQLYTSNQQNLKATGDNLTDIRHNCFSIMPSHNNPDPRAYDDFEFITSPYTLNGQTIYGLTHTEYHAKDYNNCDSANPLDCWWNSINFVVSTDQGATFTHSTPPTHNVANTSINVSRNNTQGHIGFFQPSNILFQDGYYYAKMTVITPGVPLVNSNGSPGGGICVMRTNNLADPNSWKLWDGQGFNLSPKGVPSSGNCANTFRTDWDWHKSTYLNKFVIVGAIPQGMIQTSSTLTQPDTPMFFFKNAEPQEGTTMYYTFLQPGAETRNFEDISRSPWLYFMGCGAEIDCSQGWGVNRDLKRIRVRFNKPEDVGKYDVLDLRFNEYKGSKTLDSSFYGNDGTLSGNVNFQQDGDTKFAHFSNNPGNITVTDHNSLRLTSNFTFTARIRTTQIPAPNTYPPILLKQGASRSYGIFLTPDGKVHLSLSNGSGLASSVSKQKINDGVWHDVQITFSDATGIATYVIDGKYDSQTNQGGKLSDGNSNGNLTVGGNAFIGDLDHVTLYNYLLTTPPPSPLPGDLNSDGSVNIFDYNVLVAKFGDPYTIFDFNDIVAHYGEISP